MANNREINIKAHIDAKGAVKGATETVQAVKSVQAGTEATSKSVQKMAGDTTTATGIMQSGFLGQIPIIGRYEGQIQRAITTTRGMTVSTRAFGAALAATGIGAVIAALGMLFQAFRSTQQGTDQLNRVLVPLRTIFEALWGVVQNVSIALVDGLKRGFDIVQPAGQVMLGWLQNMISGLQTTLELAGGVGRVMRGIVTLSLKEVKAGIEDAKSALDDQNQSLRDGQSWLKGWTDDIRESTRAAWEAGRQIQQLTEDIERLQIEQTVPLARLNREYRELINVARDSANTEQERLAAIDEAVAKRRQITAEELKMLDLEIERLEIQQSLNDTSREDELQMQRLLARREDLVAGTERELGRRLSMRTNIIKSIEQESAEEAAAAEEHLQALQTRADAYRELIMSEEELALSRYASELQALQALADEGVLTAEEFHAIQGALHHEMIVKRLEDEQMAAGSIAETEAQLAEARKQFREAASEEERQAQAAEIERLQAVLEDRLNTEQTAAGSIIELEQQIAEVRMMYRAAASDADREAHLEELARLQERYDAITVGEKKAADERKKSIDSGRAASVAYGQDVRSTTRNVINAIIAEAVALQLRNVIATIPFPFNLVVAGGAAAGVQALQSAIPEFLHGGMTSPGQKIISINEDGKPEYIVNAASTRAAAPLLEDINASPSFARSLADAVYMNGLLDGGFTSQPRARTGSDLPMRTDGAMASLIADAIREGMQGVRVDARISAEQATEELQDYQFRQEAIGN